MFASQFRENPINITQALTYEIKSSWWASKISNKFLSRLAGRYFAFKVKRKYDRYILNTYQSILRNDGKIGIVKVTT